MDAELKAKWLKALRGRLPGKKYRQAQEYLKVRDRFCCLGVLADIQDVKWRNGAPRLDGIETTDNCFLPPHLAGGLRKSTQEKLALMNDGGKTFAEIADYIERRLK